MELVMAKQRKAGARRPPRKEPKVAPQSTRRTAAKRAANRWSQRVTTESDALDLERGVFALSSARKIAASLKRSAEASHRRKSGAYRSALSMLTFYINRAGRNLPKPQKDRLERAKRELRHLFGRE
jgi:hypothetical protein